MLDNEGLRGIRKAYSALKNCMRNEEVKQALLKPPACPLAKRYRMEKRLLAEDRVFLAVVFKKGKYVKALLANNIRRKRKKII